MAPTTRRSAQKKTPTNNTTNNNTSNNNANKTNQKQSLPRNLRLSSERQQSSALLKGRRTGVRIKPVGAVPIDGRTGFEDLDAFFSAEAVLEDDTQHHHHQQQQQEQNTPQQHQQQQQQQEGGAEAQEDKRMAPIAVHATPNFDYRTNSQRQRRRRRNSSTPLSATATTPTNNNTFTPTPRSTRAAASRTRRSSSGSIPGGKSPAYPAFDGRQWGEFSDVSPVSTGTLPELTPPPPPTPSPLHQHHHEELLPAGTLPPLDDGPANDSFMLDTIGEGVPSFATDGEDEADPQHQHQQPQHQQHQKPMLDEELAEEDAFAHATSTNLPEDESFLATEDAAPDADLHHPNSQENANVEASHHHKEKQSPPGEPSIGDGLPEQDGKDVPPAAETGQGREEMDNMDMDDVDDLLGPLVDDHHDGHDLHGEGEKTSPSSSLDANNLSHVEQLEQLEEDNDENPMDLSQMRLERDDAAGEEEQKLVEEDAVAVGEAQQQEQREVDGKDQDVSELPPRRAATPHLDEEEVVVPFDDAANDEEVGPTQEEQDDAGEVVPETQEEVQRRSAASLEEVRHSEDAEDGVDSSGVNDVGVDELPPMDQTDLRDKQRNESDSLENANVGEGVHDNNLDNEGVEADVDEQQGEGGEEQVEDETAVLRQKGRPAGATVVATATTAVEGDRRRSKEPADASSVDDRRRSEEPADDSAVDGDRRRSSEPADTSAIQGDRRRSKESADSSAVKGDGRRSSEPANTSAIQGDRRRSREYADSSAVEGDRRSSRGPADTSAVKGDRRRSSEPGSVEGDRRRSKEPDSVEGDSRRSSEPGSVEGDRRRSKESANASARPTDAVGGDAGTAETDDTPSVRNDYGDDEDDGGDGFFMDVGHDTDDGDEVHGNNQDSIEKSPASKVSEITEEVRTMSHGSSLSTGGTAGTTAITTVEEEEGTLRTSLSTEIGASSSDDRGADGEEVGVEDGATPQSSQLTNDDDGGTNHAFDDDDDDKEADAGFQMADASPEEGEEGADDDAEHESEDLSEENFLTESRIAAEAEEKARMEAQEAEAAAGGYLDNEEADVGLKTRSARKGKAVTPGRQSIEENEEGEGGLQEMGSGGRSGKKSKERTSRGSLESTPTTGAGEEGEESNKTPLKSSIKKRKKRTSRVSFESVPPASLTDDQDESSQTPAKDSQDSGTKRRKKRSSRVSFESTPATPVTLDEKVEDEGVKDSPRKSNEKEEKKRKKRRRKVVMLDTRRRRSGRQKPSPSDSPDPFASPAKTRAIEGRMFNIVPVSDHKSTPRDEEDDEQERQVRRSKRAKFPPLKYWKNEHLIYEANHRRDSLAEVCDMPIVTGVQYALPTPMPVRRKKKRSQLDTGDEEDGNGEKRIKKGKNKSGGEDSDSDDGNKKLEPFDDWKLRQKYRVMEGNAASVWNEETQSFSERKIVSHAGDMPHAELPVGKRERGESNASGTAAQAFNVPGMNDNIPGWISGHLTLPPRGIKDAEGIGLCSQIFFVSDCHPNAFEVAIADPEGEEFEAKTAQRFLLSKGDHFHVPPNNVYRLENHSKEKECKLYWAIVRPTST